MGKAAVKGQSSQRTRRRTGGAQTAARRLPQGRTNSEGARCTGCLKYWYCTSVHEGTGALSCVCHSTARPHQAYQACAAPGTCSSAGTPRARPLGAWPAAHRLALADAPRLPAHHGPRVAPLHHLRLLLRLLLNQHQQLQGVGCRVGVGLLGQKWSGSSAWPRKLDARKLGSQVESGGHPPGTLLSSPWPVGPARATGRRWALNAADVRRQEAAHTSVHGACGRGGGPPGRPPPTSSDFVFSISVLAASASSSACVRGR